MVHLDNAQALIRWDEAEKIAVLEWRSYADGQEYRHVLGVLIEVLQKHAARKVLADTRLMKVVTQEDQAWVAKEWSPKARVAGLRYSALIVPKSALAKLSLARMITTNQADAGAGKIEHFDNIEAARSWLRSVK